MKKNQEEILSQLSQVIQTVHKLRAPGGCPWDQKQTSESLRPFLIEEAYETLDVLDQIAKSQKPPSDPSGLAKNELSQALKEELGDVLLQVLLHAEIADEKEIFNFGDVAQFLNQKLIQRHPHVFGDVKVDGAEAAYQTWEKQKALLKAQKTKSTDGATSVLEGLPKGLPALQKATRTIEKVSRVGFQWSDLLGPLQKLDEEIGELKHEISAIQGISIPDTELPILQKQKIESELGDVLFCLCNLAYLLRLNPEDALRSTLGRFESRFRYVENKLFEKGKKPENSTLQEMDEYWEQAKANERAVQNSIQASTHNPVEPLAQSSKNKSEPKG